MARDEQLINAKNFPQGSIDTPCYVLEESKLRSNLELISHVASSAGVEIILAFKAYALWRSFPIFREYISSSTASSIYEARMAYEKMGAPAHTYAPIYKESEINEILHYSSHITFNSLSQFERLYPYVERFKERKINCGLRINPECSEVETELYNPCAPGSRLGILSSELQAKGLPKGINGLHFHSHCESDSYALEKTLHEVEKKFGSFLDQVEWINFGGGHLMTRADYNVDHLISLLKAFKSRHPHLHVILEPGSAFGWQAGYLVTTIQDVVENHGIKTLMMDASFTCHMPDCLEMPYQPAVRGAKMEQSDHFTEKYRIGGNSCLSGDYMGDWFFDHQPHPGELLIFEDMVHYTTVKTTMFNGIVHPSIYLHTCDGDWQPYRIFEYEDYLNRMC